MLTIEEIKDRITHGKRKWGESLMSYIKVYFDENLPIDSIKKKLEIEYGISISELSINQIKNRYYQKHLNQISTISPINSDNNTSNIIEQKKDNLSFDFKTSAPKSGITIKTGDDLLK